MVMPQLVRILIYDGPEDWLRLTAQSNRVQMERDMMFSGAGSIREIDMAELLRLIAESNAGADEERLLRLEWRAGKIESPR
jgi:hypothetical protein